MKKSIVMIVLLIVLCSLSSCTSGTADTVLNEVKDQIENLSDETNEYVMMVKTGSPTLYPNAEYGKYFDNFFSNPTWNYFEADNKEDVVEFTGGCSYKDVEVKARLQFIVNLEKGTFEAGALSFNDIPQSTVITASVLAKVFEDAEASESFIDEGTPEESSDKAFAVDVLGISVDELLTSFNEGDSADSENMQLVLAEESFNGGRYYQLKKNEVVQILFFFSPTENTEMGACKITAVSALGESGYQINKYLTSDMLLTEVESVAQEGSYTVNSSRDEATGEFVTLVDCNGHSVIYTWGSDNGKSVCSSVMVK